MLHEVSVIGCIQGTKFFFFRFRQTSLQLSTFIWSIWVKKIGIWFNLLLAMPSQSRTWTVPRPRLGSLGRRLPMTCTQEPNTVEPQSAHCFCSRKWGTKLLVPIYFETKPSKFCFKTFLFRHWSQSFDSEDSEKPSNEHVRQVWTYFLELWEQFAIFQARTGRTSFADELLVY